MIWAEFSAEISSFFPKIGKWPRVEFWKHYVSLYLACASGACFHLCSLVQNFTTILSKDAKWSRDVTQDIVHLGGQHFFYGQYDAENMTATMACIMEAAKAAKAKAFTLICTPAFVGTSSSGSRHIDVT